MGTDGEVYRCGQIREPSVTSGIGANYGNSMILYGTDPVVVEYDPGTDIVIEKFSFLPVSDDFSRATSIPISAHSPGRRVFTTKRQEAMTRWISGNRISQGRAGRYIAADGKITVRYTAGSNAEIGVSQTLPLLMVTGRES